MTSRRGPGRRGNARRGLSTGGTAPMPDRKPMAGAKPTGYVRVIERKGGAAFYAKLKLPDGSQPQRRLGKVWTKRTRPPAGHLTRGMAEARLEAILAGD